MGFIRTLRLRIFPFWKTYVILFTPLLLLPLPIVISGLESRAAYVFILMAVYWMTEALPLPITSILPVILLPILGIMDTGAVTVLYMKEINMMLVGGIMLAISIEYCNLHRRIALRVLVLVGGGARWLLLGFMMITAGLSMWISNTATAVMILPIVEAVFEELRKDDELLDKDDVGLTAHAEKNAASSTLSLGESISMAHLVDNIKQGTTDNYDNMKENNVSKTIEWEKMRKCVFLSVAYSANMGGTGSMIGANANLILMGLIKDLYGNETGLNFASWLAFNVPGLLINLFFAWIWLQFLYIGFKRSTGNAGKEEAVKKLIRRKYEELGPISFHELSVLLVFFLSLLLWFFRNPQFMPGWGQLFTTTKVGDATAVMFILLLLFILPSQKPTCFNCNPDRIEALESSPALLNWKYGQERLPWSVLFLTGAGYALSDASKISGLSAWMGQQLTGLQVLPPFAIMAIVSIAMASVTEVVQNAATANIFLPILAQMAVAIKVNPIYLILPATITCSYAFMLPVATIPNAIVFEAAQMKTVDMVKAGSVMNIVCVTVICLLTATYGSFLFGLDEFPDWAISKN